MKEGPNIAVVASLIGDPARANMLTALMAGKALTATELANEAGITPQTASGHLAKLEGGGLVRPRKQGRHKYFNLADDKVAEAIEHLMGLAAKSGHLRTRTGPRHEGLCEARVCYNHLAGRSGTRLFDHLRARGHIEGEDDEVVLTSSGVDFVCLFGIDLASLPRRRGLLCRECLDWSERRPHLGGALARALLSRMEDLRWVRREPESRLLTFSPQGRRSFDEWLGG